MKRIFLGSMIFICLSATAVEPKIRVLIGKSLKQVQVSGVDLESKLFFKKTSQEYQGKKTLNFKCDPKTRSLMPERPVKLASVKSKTGLLNWHKDKFKGRLSIVTSRFRNGCDLINQLGLEDYLATLLPKEMSSNWPLEALKAQAVAARSYALHKLKTDQVSKYMGFNVYYDLESSEKHQVSGTFFDATKSTYKATQETRGEVLTAFGQKTLPIFFHSKCGGKTLRPDQVWENSIPGYQSVPCPFCHRHGKQEWRLVVKEKSLADYIKRALSIDTPRSKTDNLKLLSDNRLNSKIRFYQNDHFMILKKSRLRAAMGRKKLPSNNFFMREKNNVVEIKGTGYGHGVGMCQFGAKELAERGFTYRQILSHYFPNFKLTKVY